LFGKPFISYYCPLWCAEPKHLLTVATPKQLLQGRNWG
jgi:hypothetical protein